MPTAAASAELADGDPGGSAPVQRALPPDGITELVEAARLGDQDAFAALVRTTYADTYTLAVRLTGDEEDARDVVQEAYLRAFRGLKRFRGDAQFSTWMYRITANCASTHLGRRRRHRHEALAEEAQVVDLHVDHDPVLRADLGHLRAQLADALRELPPRLRAVVVLRDVYDLTHEDIAAELGISESAAKVRLHRARHKLREHLLPKRGADEDPGGAARAVS